MRVAIIDYGSGNLRSATKAFERAAREAGIAAEIDLTDRPERVATADRIVLPGVGAYADCRRGLAVVEGMEEALTEAVEKPAAPSSASASACSSCRPADSKDGDERFRLDRRRCRRDDARGPLAQDPPDRLEHA